MTSAIGPYLVKLLLLIFNVCWIFVFIISGYECNKLSQIYRFSSVNATNDNSLVSKANLKLKLKGTLNFHTGILLVVAVGVAMGVFVGGVLLVCAARHVRRYDISALMSLFLVILKPKTHRVAQKLKPL